MSNKFCHNCGKPNTAGAKFCSDCGTNLLSLAALPPKEQVMPVAMNRKSSGRGYMEDEDDDDETPLVISQTALAVEIIKDRPRGESLGSVVAQGKPTASENISRAAPYKGNEDIGKIISDFKGEVYNTPKIEID